ncbi:hypothetical protein PsorP6_014751 [Peronosclerospora sorghi]|uniref:Uncharacterized protein n=1 Tax=Peronosclerospora sorghi TaxID=230839 RepID=A0ACC0VRY0_9STRA|nr:hypothetical protein PsorP6_014751 [Peronosclerospora sorghi]
MPAKERLGVKLKHPKDGVIDHGLAIDNINNPLWENKVQAGDLIVAIGGTSVDGMGFSDAIDLFRNMPRPFAISFEIEHILSKSKWSVDNKCMAYVKISAKRFSIGCSNSNSGLAVGCKEEGID